MVILEEKVARRFLEDRGKWQTTQIVLCCIGFFSNCFETLLIVFTGFQPKFRCLDNLKGYNDSGYTAFDNECGIFNASVNSSIPCSTGFVFDVNIEASIVSEWELICEKSYLSETSQLLFTIGMAAGSIFATSLADRFGRRPTYLVIRILYTIFSFGIAWSPSIIWFMFGRFVLGILCMAFYLISFVLLMEVSPVRLRPFSLLMTAILWPIAQCIMPLIGYLMRGLSWRYIQIVVAIPTLSVILDILFLKESILWMYANKRERQASVILENALKRNGLKLEDYVEDTTDLTEKTDSYKKSHEIRDQESPKMQTDVIGKKISILDILRNRSMLILTLIVAFTWFADCLIYYAIYFMSDSYVGGRYMNFFLNAVVDIPGAFMVYGSLKCFDRKKALVGLHAICALPLLAGGVMMVTLVSETKYIVMQIITTFGKLVNSATYCLIYIYSTEIFPTNFRTTGMGICSVAARLGSFMSPFAGIMAKAIPWGPGIIFGGLCLLVTILMFWVPETRGTSLPQSLRDVDILIRHKTPSKKQSSTRDVTDK